MHGVIEVSRSCLCCFSFSEGSIFRVKALKYEDTTFEGIQGLPTLIAWGRHLHRAGAMHVPESKVCESRAVYQRAGNSVQLIIKCPPPAPHDLPSCETAAPTPPTPVLVGLVQGEKEILSVGLIGFEWISRAV